MYHLGFKFDTEKTGKEMLHAEIREQNAVCVYISPYTHIARKYYARWGRPPPPHTHTVSTRGNIGGALVSFCTLLCEDLWRHSSVAEIYSKQ
jgi:hypothetical protein